jgi:hypothetical protein
LNLGRYTRDPKNPIKNRWLKPSQQKQKGKAKERPKKAAATGTKEGRDLVPLGYIQDK